MRERNYKFDNMKLILIFLVILGHLLEVSPVFSLYKVIYSFHIPALIFISGYFSYSKPDVKLVRTILVPYLIFQPLYLLLDAYYVQQTGEMKLQYAVPYWLLWYLIAYFGYSMLTPLFDCETKRGRVLGLLIALAISLLCGYDTNVGYEFSLARTCCFLPFWVAGYYLGHGSGYEPNRKKTGTDYVMTVACVAVIVGCTFIFFSKQWPASIMYGANSYKAGAYNAPIRLLIHVMGAAWIYLLVKWIPNVKIPVLTGCGRNTMAIFLCHGFIIKYIVVEHRAKLELPLWPRLLVMSGVALLIIVTFGNRYFGRVFRKIVTLDFGRNKQEIPGNTDNK